MHFYSVSKLHVHDVKFKGKMESICQCITLLHVLHLKSDTLTEILQSHYTHYTLKSLQCVTMTILSKCKMTKNENDIAVTTQ